MNRFLLFHLYLCMLCYRLFFVCKPIIPPMRLLEDTFKMFKGLRNINVIDGKNYGYVTYDNLESATRAINVILFSYISIDVLNFFFIL